MIANSLRMTQAVHPTPKLELPLTKIAWFSLLLVACYAPVLKALVTQWFDDPDMGHGIFVPVIAAYIVWQQREELAILKPKPNWWGLLLVLFGGAQLIFATMGVELFLARTAFVITVIGVIWTLGGSPFLKKLAFPLFLLLFMVPIPTILYTRITFPLQILASKLADQALMMIDIPVVREGNVLELATQKLSVVEACSGIRSLLTLTFLSLVYGHFFEKRVWLRVVLFLATIPIAILSNGSRVTLTGILTQVKPELAEGFFHETTGMVTFILSAVILIVLHRLLARAAGFVEARRVPHALSQ